MADSNEDDSRHDDRLNKGQLQTDARATISQLNQQMLAASRALLAAVKSFDQRWTTVDRLNVNTFAAYEACRGYEESLSGHKGSRFKSYYIITCCTLFLLGTLFSPYIVASFPASDRSINWDMAGLASTSVVLAFTYGPYAIIAFLRLLYKLLDILVSLPEAVSKSLPLISDDSEQSAHELLAATVCLVLGFILFVSAWAYIAKLGDQSAFIHAHRTDRLFDSEKYTSEYAHTYYQYLWKILELSLLFIFMDVTVAAFNNSHSETFIASSSAMFVSVPMFIGVALVTWYMGLEYSSAVSRNVKYPYGELSVEFAAGALTFQMMLSNLVFVIMQLNLVFWLLYRSVQTSKRP